MTTSDDLLKRLDERDKEVAPGNLYGLAAARIRELEAQYEELYNEVRSLLDLEGMRAIKAGTHVIVPVEPTEAMDNAGAEAIVQHYDHYEAGAVTDVYEAMIRAATQETE